MFPFLLFQLAYKTAWSFLGKADILLICMLPVGDNIAEQIGIGPLLRGKLSRYLMVCIPSHDNRVDLFDKLRIGVLIFRLTAFAGQPSNAAVGVRDISIQAHGNKQYCFSHITLILTRFYVKFH